MRESFYLISNADFRGLLINSSTALVVMYIHPARVTPARCCLTAGVPATPLAEPPLY